MDVPFSFVSTPTTTTLAPGSSFSVGVRFSPTSTGTFTDSFRIVSNDPNESSVTVGLRGVGIRETTQTPPCPVDSTPTAGKPDLTGKFYPSRGGNGRLFAKFLVKNIGTGDAGRFRVALYASKDSTLSNDDRRIGTRLVNGLDAKHGKLLRVPKRFVKPGCGNYLFAIVDWKDKVSEGNEKNNIIRIRIR